MVDFQGGPKPRNYLARREQRRLLMLVLSLGLIFILMGEARRPENWRWLTGAAGGDGRAIVAAPKGNDDTAPVEGVPVGNTRGPLDIEWEPDLLRTIRNDAPFRAAEQDVWFAMLRKLDETDESLLEESSSGRVTYAQLIRQPNAYCGDLVTIGGTVRRVSRLKAPRARIFGKVEDEDANKGADIISYYRLWIQPPGRGTSLVVYCLYLPASFPIGMEVDEAIDVTGLYFKRWAYQAQGGLRTAPLLLARTVHWFPRAETQQRQGDASIEIKTILGGAAAISLLVVLFVTWQTRRRCATQRKLPAQIELSVANDVATTMDAAREGDDASHTTAASNAVDTPHDSGGSRGATTTPCD